MGTDPSSGFEILMAIRGDIGELKAMTTATQKTLTEHVAENRSLTSRVAALEIGHLANKEAADTATAAAKTAAIMVLRA